MSKASHKVLVLVLYLNFLLWHLGSQLKPAIADRLLPDDEVSTLTTVLTKLGFKTSSDINNTYCKNRLISDSSYIRIDCDCTDKDTQGNQTCHIATIIVNNVGLTTVIPEELGDLRYLSSLNLSNSELHGPIPAALGNLIYLKTLDLSKNQLTGSIPETLGRLQKLRSLNLQNNLLDSTIPRTLGSLPNLELLALSNNQPTGSIPPTLGSLRNLRWLYLDYNLLDSTIPRTLGSLSNLERLYLEFNRLSGSIPDELGNLVNLTSLVLTENRLSGPLPETLGNLSLLRLFWASANSFSATIPDSYGQLKSLQAFSITGNYISGPLPVDIIKRWINIKYLSLLGNNFKGNLTKEVFNLPNLLSLLISDLRNASFELPSEITNTQFESLILRNCSIIGSIPKYIDQMPYLTYLDLGFNNLTGGLPESMKSNLRYMSFSTNMLNGTIPSWILQAVQTRIDLSFNNFSALDVSEVPSNNPDMNLLACCRNSSATEPEIMYMTDPLNMMNTYCPGEEQKYHSLFINCGGGETIVNGTVYDQDDATSRFYTSPKKNWAYSSSGDFLAKNANSNDYTKKNVTSRVSLYDSARLAPVSLKYYAFCLREGNYTVSLKFAEIVYTQDTDYTSLRKRAFDVYIQDDKVLHNFDIREQARGPNIPITKNFTAVVNKNNSLLMIHMYWDGKGSSEVAPAFNGPLISAISVTPGFKIHNEKLRPLHIALIVIASTIIAMLLLLAFAGSMAGWEAETICVISSLWQSTASGLVDQIPDIDEYKVLEQFMPSWMKPLFSGLGSGLGVLLLLIGVWRAHKAVKKRKIIKRRELFFKRNGGLLLEQQISAPNKVNVERLKLFNSKELEKSTDNFNIDRVLGQGGQGTVFKGMLADGNIVAVKKSKIHNKGKVAEFINEVIILSQINHRNIVRLLGCCLETEVPLLVYEFIPNGTLSQYIYEQNEEFPLTWQMRLTIATEIAGALSYLHVAASCPIYHRDIKSTNILIDEKYRAKIADFGTSRSIAIDQTHLTTKVHGTFGYMDPEYFQSSQFTEKSDVYSFGVVLVELLTGKKPISAVTRSSEEEEEQEYRNLAAYFIDSMQEHRLFYILDARVVNEGSEEDIVIVANLARRCLNLNGRNRPTMREVTAELEAVQMSNRTHHEGAEFIPEHYPIQQCDDVVSSSGASTWDSGPASSLLEFPQSSM